MTRNPHPTPARRSRRGLFQAGPHVAAVHCGSGLVVLDLERGTAHAASPDGADAWQMLVEDLQDDSESDLPEAPGRGKRRAVMAWVADYLLERCLIEPRKRGAGVREASRATRDARGGLGRKRSRPDRSEPGEGRATRREAPDDRR